MITENQLSRRNADNTLETLKETHVIQHVYNMHTKNALTFSKIDDSSLRRMVVAFKIAENDSAFPSIVGLKDIIKNTFVGEHDFDNIGGFCIKCLVDIKAECKKKFGGTW